MPALTVNLVLMPGGPPPTHRVLDHSNTGLGVVDAIPGVSIMSRHPELLEQVGDAFLTAARDLREVQDELVAEPIGAAEVVRP